LGNGVTCGGVGVPITIGVCATKPTEFARSSADCGAVIRIVSRAVVTITIAISIDPLCDIAGECISAIQGSSPCCIGVGIAIAIAV
jgi:hypothetical protein